ncbi:hypothetical protein B7463_g3157, partial [Scytalidium lignicola]
MRLLLQGETGELGLTEFRDNEIPDYAILSHTWAEDQEVTFEDLMDSTGKSKSGYKKIQFCGEQARQDKLKYF